ncbi:MAG: hypothetical protein RBU30_05130 [Polyangia bacterium]|jgi:hypothetical protein|nr:hypothetical protein [Polyangia bacterium]
MQSQQDIRDKISGSMIAHPRVLHQRLLRDGRDAERFASALPVLVPFRKSAYHDFIPILDWDHKLPSSDLVLRLYAFYTKDSAEVGWADQRARAEEIARIDKYPEFDIPDFADLVADEAYEIVLHLDGALVSSRLTSAWRRELAPRDASQAIQVVRASREFQALKEKAPDRPQSLGDAEATSWTPPCESNYQRWTLDVWYLLSYDGMFGQGRSFLVDLEEERVVSVREFTLRPG